MSPPRRARKRALCRFSTGDETGTAFRRFPSCRLQAQTPRALSPAMTTRDTPLTTTRHLQITEHLRPDGDHAHEQRQRGERGGFLDDGFDHGFSPWNGEGT